MISKTCLMREERLTLILRIGSIGRLKVFQGQGEDATIILIVKKHPSLRRILVHEGRRRQIRRHSLRDLFALRWHELLLKHFTPPGLTSGEYPVWLPSEFPPCHDRADEQDGRVQVDETKMAERRQTIDVVERQGQPDRNDGREKCCPQSPPLPGANSFQGQSDHGHAKANDEGRHGDLQVADVVVKMRTEALNLLRSAPNELGGQTELNETREVTDEEHQTIADKTETGQCDKIGAEAGRARRSCCGHAA